MTKNIFGQILINVFADEDEIDTEVILEFDELLCKLDELIADWNKAQSSLTQVERHELDEMVEHN